MPITASLGALSYSKTSLGEDYEYWYMRVITDCTFNDITFDNDGAFYTTGITQQFPVDNTTMVCKFKENNGYPSNIIQESFFNVSGAQPETATAIRFSNTTSTLGIIGSADTPYLATFPYYLTRWGYTLSLNANLVIYPGTSESGVKDYGAYGVPPSSNVSTQRRPEDMVVDSTNGNCYIVGTTTDFNTAGTQLVQAVYYEKWSGFALSDSVISNNTVRPTANTAPRIDGSTSIDLNSNKDPVVCYTIQDTSNTTTRRTTIRKLSKTPNPSPTYLPIIWQRSLTGSTTLQSRLLRIDSSDNVYIIATTSTNGYLIKYNNSGVLQWQRQIANIQLKGLYVTSTGDSYILGYNTSNNLFIAKYNSSGTIQWQNKLSGLTYVGNRIIENGSALYIIGSANSIAFAVKLPNDGSIPGSGSYFIGGSTTITYSIATQTESAASLTDNASTDNYAYPTSQITTTSGITNPTSITNTIINL